MIEKNKESTAFAVTATYEYDAFGGLTSGTGAEADSNAFRYNGQYTDEETGLIYLRNRYYDPETGRFTQEDTYWNPNNMIYGDSGNNNIPSYESISQSANLYVYCMNDPVNRIDPTGKFNTGWWSYYITYRSYQTIKYYYGTDIANQELSIKSSTLWDATIYGSNIGLGDADGNQADAYRHFMWSARMTREIGYYESRFIGNIYESYEMEQYGFKSTDTMFTTLDSPYVYGKMNQPMLMDLWNNQVGRELANNSVYRNMSNEQLFNMALSEGLLITDQNTVYDKLGITYLISDASTYTVDVKWNIETSEITLYYYGEENITIKIGI